MALRPSSRCRRTLAKAPTSASLGVWITERMLFEAFQRYSLSSARTNGSDTRCVHFNAGPLEHRRRTGKRRMTAVLPVSRLDIPAWTLPLAQDNSAPTWLPPKKPSERHQKPGLLNQLITWLEAYPPDQPFIAPPSDETIGRPVTDSAGLETPLNAADALAVDGLGSRARSRGILDPRELISNLQIELLAAPQDFKARRAILNKYSDTIMPYLADLVLLQSGEHAPGESERAALRGLLDPLGQVSENAHWADVELAQRLSAHWQARITRTLSDLVNSESGLESGWIWTELAKFLCEPRSAEAAASTSDSFYHWCSSLKQLSRAVKELPSSQQSDLMESMQSYLREAPTAQNRMSPQQSHVIDARLGWAMTLLWRPPTGIWKSAFNDIYRAFECTEASPLRDERTFYLVMSELGLSLSLSRDDFTFVFAHRDKASRWSALFATLAGQGSRASRLLQKVHALLTRMDYTEEVAAAVRAETDPALARCVEGLVIAMGDYRAALEWYGNQSSADSGLMRQPWSYQTWSLYVNAMIQDHRVGITETTALIGSLEPGQLVNGVSLSRSERLGRAKLLESMSHTLAYHSPKFRPWRVWKELQVWNQLFRKFTGKFSPKISQVMMDLTLKRLEQGEVISTRRLKLIENIVRAQAGEEQAEIFGERIVKWRDRNRYLGTEQQKFPLRFRPDYSPAELVLNMAEMQLEEERVSEKQETRGAATQDAFAAAIMAARVEDIDLKPKKTRLSPVSGPQHVKGKRKPQTRELSESHVPRVLREGSRFA